MKNKYKYLIYSFVISFIVLMFTSKSSFLYPINDWVDANAFFTMGKSMFKGVVPYRDLFEQKGIVLFFIYGLGSLISYKSFIGVFFFEVISFGIFLYYAYKIFSMFFDEKKSIILLPLLAVLITASYSFTHGGSSEEFCFPYLCINLYYFIRHFKEKEINNKEIIILGIMTSIVLNIKYTLLGLFIGTCIFYMIDYFKKKKYKEFIKFCLYYLLGILIVLIPCFIYLGINHAIKDYIDCYFIINITAYGSAKINIFLKLFKIVKGFYYILYKNKIMLLVLGLFPLFLFMSNIDKKIKSKIFYVYLINIFFIYYGAIFYRYYVLPIYVFIIISLISIVLILEKYKKKINKKLIKYSYYIIPIICIFCSYYFANYRYLINSKKEDYFQFKYADYISKDKNPTMLNMGYLDCGIYTITGIIPNTRFFQVHNLEYDRFPDNLDDMKDSVINKKIKYIVYYTKQLDDNYIMKNDPYIYDNYELVYKDDNYYEKHDFKCYLFKLKGI